MNNIRTYDDLIVEKQRLEGSLTDQREAIRRDLTELKDEFKPALQLASFIGKVSKPVRNNPLAAIGMALATDILLPHSLLAGTGKITRLVVPFLLKKTATLFRRKRL